MLKRATAVLLFALLSTTGCRDESPIWQDAEPPGAVRVIQVSEPPAGSGRGGRTLIAYRSRDEFDSTIDAYVQFFRARGVAPQVRELSWVLFDDPNSGSCLRVERWSAGTGVPLLRLELDADQERRLDNEAGSFWVSVPDECADNG
jgi:hypothetical protein